MNQKEISLLELSRFKSDVEYIIFNRSAIKNLAWYGKLYIKFHN